MIIEVDRADDQRLDAFRWRERQLTTIAQRRNAIGEGQFIAEGDLVVERALAAGCTPEHVLCDPKTAQRFSDRIAAAGGVTLVATADIRREVTGLGVPLDAIGVFRRPAVRSLSDVVATSTRLIILDGIDNPSNVGSIVRSAAALGWDGLLLDTSSSDPLARRALRVAMGTTFALPHARYGSMPELIDSLASRNFEIVGLTPAHPTREVLDMDAISPTTTPRALVLGSERSGLSSQMADACTHLASIPMREGIDSLNVAIAAGIACYALR
jgi:tRNA G18 (ribose-2'-O)-methylase SpoU